MYTISVRVIISCSGFDPDLTECFGYALRSQISFTPTVGALTPSQQASPDKTLADCVAVYGEHPQQVHGHSS